MSEAPSDTLETPLARGLTALDLEADASQRRRLIGYLRLIERWNRVYNLTAVRDPQEMVTQHLLDSLAVVAPLRRHALQRAWAGDGAPRRLLDVGSGAGVPGVVLAIMDPGLQVTCVDAVAKKAGFIRQAAGELGLQNLQSEHARVEQMNGAPFDVITARAFSSLADLVALTRHLLAPSGLWVAMKGRAPDEEVAALPLDVEVFHVEQLQVPGLDARRCLVWMRIRSPQ